MVMSQDLPPETILYRRIPAVCGWVRSDGKVDLAAFLPNKADVDGLPLSRTPSEKDAAETGRAGKQFFAVSLRVAEIQAFGLSIRCDRPDHAIIQGWTFQTRNDRRVREGAEHQTAICGRAVGPFEGKA